MFLCSVASMLREMTFLGPTGGEYLPPCSHQGTGFPLPGHPQRFSLPFQQITSKENGTVGRKLYRQSISVLTIASARMCQSWISTEGSFQTVHVKLILLRSPLLRQIVFCTIYRDVLLLPLIEIARKLGSSDLAWSFPLSLYSFRRVVLI